MGEEARHEIAIRLIVGAENAVGRQKARRGGQKPGGVAEFDVNFVVAVGKEGRNLRWRWWW